MSNFISYWGDVSASRAVIPVITAGCLSFLLCWPGRHIICPTGMTLFRR